jgi:hypothetical protein
MSDTFSAGDFLIFQLESGYGLLRVLAVDDEGSDTVWHLGVYEELFPDVDPAEQALAHSGSLHFSKPHLALTNRAFERTPAAKLGHRAIVEEELSGYRQWQRTGDRLVFDRSLLLLLGMR